jgi:predicted enzyme related to lactoylglutathione lyase
MGWTVIDAPGNSGHQFFQVNGQAVASLHSSSQARDAWVPCVSVESVESKTAEAVALGSTLMDQIELPGIARMATLCDSESNVFGLWEPAPVEGVELVNDLGSLWWIEVLSNNVDSAREFYCRLFGWTSQETAFEPFSSYIFFKRGDAQESGILPIQKSWGIQPRWNSIFEVDDCDATIARAFSSEAAMSLFTQCQRRGVSVSSPTQAALSFSSEVLLAEFKLSLHCRRGL